MALIKCPECGKEVSDKADKCIHCGYPLSKNSFICEYFNGKNIDVSFLLDSSRTKSEKLEILMTLSEAERTPANLIDATKIICKYSPPDPKPTPQPNLPKCPRCGSTAITAGQRGWNLMWGFIGSSDTVNRCSNCGHKWKPGK